LCNSCKTCAGFVIKIYLYIVVANTTYRGVSVCGLQDSAINRIFQGADLG